MPGTWPGFGPNRVERFQPTPQGVTWLRENTQTAKARIQATQTKTQTAKASLGAKTDKTQTAKARLRVTRTQTQTAKARITAVATKTQTAKARIEVSTTTKTQAAKARVATPTTKAQPAKGRVRVTTAQAQNARARISATNLRILEAATPGQTVQYGDFKLDQTNGIIITSEYTGDDTSPVGLFQCEFRCRLLPSEATGNVATDDATFAARITNLETKLRIPRQTLLVKIGSSTVKNWDFTKATQTAFLIMPELVLLRQNRRDYAYSFRVRCEFPANVPANAFRRESQTATGTSLRERRTCTISAIWTSSAGKTAKENYDDGAETFFAAYLPSNVKDQYGTTATWIRADENPVTTNDENSVCSATRVYWEVFSGRRDSAARRLETIGDRRVFTCASTWVATSTGTALQNYLDGGDPFYGAVLPGPVAPGARWVLVDQDPVYNDQNGVLNVVRTYHEVVNGLREVEVRTLTEPSQLRTVVLTGAYYATELSAHQNYKVGIDKLVRDELAKLDPPFTTYESKSVPKVEGYDTTGKRYFFTWTIKEIGYPQGQGGPDDSRITISSLDLEDTTPKDPQSIPSSVSLTRLRTIRAHFVASIDYTKEKDPRTVWTDGARDYVITAVRTKLGGDPVVDVVDERVSVALHSNGLVGTLWMVVEGGSVLSMQITQTKIQVPARDFAARGDGTSMSGYPYRDVAELILKREAVFEYVVGETPPDPFGSSDVSGFGLISTSKTAQQSIDEQNASGILSLGSGWFIDRRAPVPYARMERPMTRGTDYQTVLVAQTETWRFLIALEPGVTL